MFPLLSCPLVYKNILLVIIVIVVHVLLAHVLIIISLSHGATRCEIYGGRGEMEGRELGSMNERQGGGKSETHTVERRPAPQPFFTQRSPEYAGWTVLQPFLARLQRRLAESDPCTGL
jgi:hypothetical protein